MGVKEEVLMAAKELVKLKGKNELTIKEVFKFMQKNKTKYKLPTIRSQIGSRCCVNSPRHHEDEYKYFKRIKRGVYKIIATEE